jgi:hypothetical protein
MDGFDWLGFLVITAMAVLYLLSSLVAIARRSSA